MTRFFKVELDTLNLIRLQVMMALHQPNARADEPWPLDGTFHDGLHGYVALGEHHTTGEFAPLLNHLITLPSVEEINQENYFAAMEASR